MVHAHLAAAGARHGCTPRRVPLTREWRRTAAAPSLSLSLSVSLSVRCQEKMSIHSYFCTISDSYIYNTFATHTSTLPLPRVLNRNVVVFRMTPGHVRTRWTLAQLGASPDSLIGRRSVVTLHSAKELLVRVGNGGKCFYLMLRVACNQNKNLRPNADRRCQNAVGLDGIDK